jgi:hypothetical protein
MLAAHPELDRDQAAAVRGLSRSGNAVGVVRGRAGTGKSATMRVYREACDMAGIPVIGVAPTAQAAHLSGESAEILKARTVHLSLAELKRMVAATISPCALPTRARTLRASAPGSAATQSRRGRGRRRL